MALAWYMVIGVCLVLLDVTLADWGLLLPVALGLCFYATIRSHWLVGLGLGAAAAVSSELLLARTRSELLLLPVVAFAAVMWKKHGDRRSVISQVVPGAVLGLVHGLYVGLGENWGEAGNYLLVSPLRLALVLAGALLMGALGMPVAIRLADAMTGGMDMPRYDRNPITGRRAKDDA